MSFEDLIIFLNNEKREDLRRNSSSTLLKLTGTSDGTNSLLSQENILYALFQRIKDPDINVAKTCLETLINISAEKKGSSVLFNLTHIDVIKILVEHIKDPESSHADYICGIFANMTRWADLCQKILNKTHSEIHYLVYILCQVGYNKKGASLDLLAPVIANFTQLAEGRREILNREKCIFVRLLPFTDFTESKTRRKGIISAIHNCCFEKDYHEWLLGPEVELASKLTLPLTGPDSFTLEENESLPLDLQFMTDDKKREVDQGVRVLLLEAIMQLCTTQKGRQILRDLNIYLILREHHKWEKDTKCLMLNEDIANILIKREDEMGAEDLSTVEVPPDVAKKFTDFDAQMLAKEIEESH